MEADRSFDGQESIDLTSVIAEFPNGDDHPGKLIPIKKLSEVFDSCVKGGDNSMKVFLRVRPAQKKEETTITIESDFSIVTNAPEGSKRAMYTKTESRNYVSISETIVVTISSNSPVILQRTALFLVVCII